MYELKFLIDELKQSIDDEIFHIKKVMPEERIKSNVKASEDRIFQ